MALALNNAALHFQSAIAPTIDNAHELFHWLRQLFDLTNRDEQPAPQVLVFCRIGGLLLERKAVAVSNGGACGHISVEELRLAKHCIECEQPPERASQQYPARRIDPVVGFDKWEQLRPEEREEF